MDEIVLLCDIPIKLKTYYESSYPVNILININVTETRILISIILFFGFLMSEIITRLFFGMIGFVISYQLYYTYGPRKIGDYSLTIIKLDRVYVHHWLYCFVILIITWLLGISNPFIIGLCSGGITHGIQFSDWHIIYK